MHLNFICEGSPIETSLEDLDLGGLFRGSRGQ